MTVKERTEAQGLGARRMLSYRAVSALARLILCAVISCTLIAALPGCGGSGEGGGTAEALPSSEIAARLCRRWQQAGGEVFSTLLRPLMEEEA